MSVNESLATTANYLLYGSMASYTVAFLGFTLDLAGGAARAERAFTRAVLQRELAPVGAPRPPRDDAPAGSDVPPVQRRAAGIGVSLTLLAVLLHVAAVAVRGVATQRPPWGNMYEFATAGSAVVAVVFVATLRWRDLRYLGTFVIGPVLLMLGLAVTVLYTRAGQLVPSLKSVWLAIHVSVAFISSALFTIAFSLTVLYLVQERRERSPVASRSFMDALPQARELDLASYRLHAVAFPLWTFTLVAGAIWAENAWGRYWGWDPKEVWTFVIWVVYAAYLHSRATSGISRQTATYIALAG
ncbi:MAG: c-type cytochrome biogenesis protein CcsB, partial [Actinomycetota bacterium]